MISGTRSLLTAEIARQARLAQEIARGQADISSGKRLQAASDDPAASARIAEIRRTQANQLAWSANLDAASAIAAQVDGSLAGAVSAFDRARELMLSANSDTQNAGGRAAIAIELRGIADEIASYAADKDSRGYPLFPADDALLIPIGPGVRIAATVSRAAVFENVPTAGGPMDLEQILRAAADAIEISDDAARAAASSAALAAIEAGGDHVIVARGEQGVRAARIDVARERIASSRLLLEEERGGLEGTDITATIARINARQLSLEAAQAVFARLNRSTLFDLLG